MRTEGDSSSSRFPSDPACATSPSLATAGPHPPPVVNSASKGPAGEEASENDPTGGTGSSDSDEVQVPQATSTVDRRISEVVEKGTSKTKDVAVKKASGRPAAWMGRSSGASDIVSSFGDPRSPQKLTKARRPMVSSMPRNQTVTAKDMSAVEDPADDVEEVVTPALVGSRSRDGQRTKASRCSSAEIQPGAVRVRGVNGQEGDESSSKFEDDPTILVPSGQEERTASGTPSRGGLESLEPLDEIESGAFTASTSAMTIGGDRQSLRDSLTAVTATAVSHDDLEQEVRDRIRREAVVARAARDDSESAPDGPTKTQKTRRIGLIVGLIFIVACVIVGVTLIVVLQDSNSSSPSAADASNTTQSRPRVWTPEELKEFIVGELGTSKGFELPGFTPAKASYDLIVSRGVFDNVTLGTRLMDAFVILALWAGTGGKEGWTRSDGWNQNPYPCTWYGIGCNEDGRVAKIRVPGNGLIGPLNPDLHYLADHLTHLDVSDNRVGLFKFNLTSLPKLQHLNFSRNANKGFTIEGAIHYNLTRLEILDLSYCALEGPISAEIARLSELRTLHLQNNALTGPIPSEIASLTNLTSLRLEGNELDGSIPVDVCSGAATAFGANVNVSVDCASVNCSCCFCEPS